MSVEEELEPIRQYLGKEFGDVAAACRKYVIPAWSLRNAVTKLAAQPDLQLINLDPHEPMNYEPKGGRLRLFAGYVGEASLPTEKGHGAWTAARDYLDGLGTRTGLEIVLEGVNGTIGTVHHPSSYCGPNATCIVAVCDVGGDGVKNHNLRLMIEKR